MQPFGTQAGPVRHMGNIHIKIIISVCQRQSMDAVGEAMKFKRNACFCQCSAQHERVSGIIAVGLSDKEGRRVAGDIFFRRKIKFF